MNKNKFLTTSAIVSMLSMQMLAAPVFASDIEKYGIEKDFAGTCNYAATDAKDYTGKTLNIITHAIPVIGEPTALHAKQFSKLTGAEVNVVHVPFGDLFQRIMIPFQSGKNAYDVLFYPSLWIGDLNRFLEPVPEYYQNSTGMQDVTVNYKGVATWNGEMLQYPMDGDRHYLKYRTDVFDDADVQAKYKADTGRDLKVPETWADYNAVAAYFTNKDWDGDGEPNFGSAEVAKRDDLMFSAFISRVAPFAKHPDVPGGFFFDLESMQPLVNTPGWVKGLELFIDAQKSFPPGGSNFGLGDEIFSFGGGQTLMSYSWDDAFIQAQQKDSKIRNKVAAAPLPGASEVWNRKTAQWDKFETPNRAPYITWGWTSAVSNISEEKQMAFDYLCFFSSESNTEHDLQIGRYGVNPYRNSHFDVSFWKDKLGWADKTAETYVSTLSGMDKSQNRVFDLRVPGVSQFMSAMAAGVAEAMAGQKTPQEALDGVADEWAQIVERVGKDRLRDAYAQVVDLEDNNN
ncbi:MAG: extracellular solute-binding protein [OCS116 cluster bacterium]|nr:extracellular solute-binding protein [OCS116 cluster bacterium]